MGFLLVLPSKNISHYSIHSKQRREAGVPGAPTTRTTPERWWYYCVARPSPLELQTFSGAGHGRVQCHTKRIISRGKSNTYSSSFMQLYKTNARATRCLASSGWRCVAHQHPDAAGERTTSTTTTTREASRYQATGSRYYSDAHQKTFATKERD